MARLECLIPDSDPTVYDSLDDAMKDVAEGITP